MSRQEQHADLFLVFSAGRKTWPKAFHSYSFIKLSRSEASGHFLVNFMKWSPWKPWRVQKFRLQFWLCTCISKFYDCTKVHYHQVAGEKLSMIKIFNCFVSDHLNLPNEKKACKKVKWTNTPMEWFCESRGQNPGGADWSGMMMMGLHFQQKFQNGVQNFCKNSRAGISKAFNFLEQVKLILNSLLVVKNSDLCALTFPEQQVHLFPKLGQTIFPGRHFPVYISTVTPPPPRPDKTLCRTLCCLFLVTSCIPSSWRILICADALFTVAEE